MSKISSKEVLLGPLNKNNLITVQVLGICPALAVTARLKPALMMVLSMAMVVAFANVIISPLYNTIPNRIYIIVQLMVVAAFITIVNEILKAYVYGVSKELSVHIGLITTNCILMDRLEAFALAHGPKASFLDGTGNGLGYGLVLVIIGLVRGLLGGDSLLGFQITLQAHYDMSYIDYGLMIISLMALIVLACIVWIQRNKLKDLQERQPSPTPYNFIHPTDKV